jgi:Flp pilus assembly protein TadD
MNRNLGKIASFSLVLLMLGGCSGLQKMKKNAGQIRYTVSPEILETKAGKVDVTINGMFPGSYFDRKTILTVKPVINFPEGETRLKPVVLQGEKVKANNREISRETGGNFTYKDQFDYRDVMRKSDVVITAEAQRGKKKAVFDPVRIGKGVLSTGTLVQVTPLAVIGIRREANNTGKYDPMIDPFQRIVPDEMLADIYYLINSSVLRPEEVKSKDVQEFLAYTKDASFDQRKELKKVEISAYASPDGTIDINADLASQREKASTSFVEAELKKAKVEANLRARYTPEDWDGFREMLERSNIQDKELILRVLSMYTDPDVREREIRNLSAAFTQVADEVLPKLRRAKLLTTVDIIGKTDEEIVAIAESRPASLNPAELLYAASLTDDEARKLKIYRSFSQVFPGDWRGYNNEGVILFRQGKFDDAERLFGQAEKLKSDEPVVKNNLGAIALLGKELEKAEEYFGAASGSGNEVNYNLGLIRLLKGEYLQATRYFRNHADINTALAKILTNNYNGALNDLEGASDGDRAMKEYLKAVIGSRTSNEKLMFESLENGLKANPTLKKTAATDMEFIKFFDNSKFKAITGI